MNNKLTINNNWASADSNIVIRIYLTFFGDIFHTYPLHGEYIELTLTGLSLR